MSDIFVDTSGWAELIDPNLRHHALAAKIYRQARQQGRKLITSNYIITELVALLTSPLRIPRSQTIEFINSLKKSPCVEVVHIDITLDNQTWQLVTQREDKNWSLVDCSSFVIMRQRHIMEALTTDHHFEQAGFIRLLKSE
jgi:uncharacterized protein